MKSKYFLLILNILLAISINETFTLFRRDINDMNMNEDMESDIITPEDDSTSSTLEPIADDLNGFELTSSTATTTTTPSTPSSTTDTELEEDTLPNTDLIGEFDEIRITNINDTNNLTSVNNENDSIDSLVNETLQTDTETETEPNVKDETLSITSTAETTITSHGENNYVNCTLFKDSVNCTNQEHHEQSFECELVPKLAHLQNETLKISNLIIKPEMLESHESLKLLMKVPADRFSISNASVRAYTVINHKMRNQTSLYSSQNLTSSPGFLVKDRECFTQLTTLAKNVLIEQFRIFVYLHHTATFV